MGTMTYVQAVLALVLVLGLIMGMAWLLRRYGLGDGGRSVLGRKKRLTTVESASVDPRHRLVLVRRDNVEHLLMVGHGDSLVIERGIPAQLDDETDTSPGSRIDTKAEAVTSR